MSTDRNPRLQELGAFLRAQKDQLRPEDVGLDLSLARRQVAGLRREEVADLTFISRECYLRIEQGRVPPSNEVLGRLIALLCHTEDEARYARQLLAGAGLRASPMHTEPVASEPLSRLLRHLTDVPAILVGPQTSVLEWNAAAADLFIDFATVPANRRTFAYLLFDDATMQSRFLDLASMQDVVVGILRATGTDSLDNRVYSAQLQVLSTMSPAFHERWHQFGVAQPRGLSQVPLRRPDGTELVVDLIVLLLDDPSQRLLLFLR